MKEGPLKVLSIDAWRDDGGWYWNNSYTLETGVYLENPTPRRVARWLRERGYLSEASKGNIHIDMGNAYEGTLIEVQDKLTGEPLIALSNCHGV